MVIEPVLGEGGYVPAPTAFLEGLVAICREHGILFLADEVQTGFGRTGTMFCVDQHGITPDVVIMAKGLASGFPISAVGASTELMARWPTGSHGGTYGGNPIGCAAAIATLEVLTEPGFLDHVRERGEQLRAGLRALAAEDGGIVEVRGPGLMVASQLADAARVPQVTAHCLSEGHLILMNAGTFGDVIRWMPPLVVSEAEVDTALDAFAKALAATR
jgi:4-aminobutyrate aminotransferase-like enzyme